MAAETGAWRSIRWKLLLAVPVFLHAAFMGSSEPERDVLRSEQPAELRISSPQNGGEPESAEVRVAPGAPGANRFTVVAAGLPLPEGSEALLRISLPVLDVPQRTVPLACEDGNRFAGEDTLPAAGECVAEIVVRQIGAYNAAGAVTIAISAMPPRLADPAPPTPEFGPLGAAGVAMATVLLSAGAVASGVAERRYGIPLGFAGVAAGTALLLARVQPAATPVVAAPATIPTVVAAATPELVEHDHHMGTPATAMDLAVDHPTLAPLPTLGADQDTAGPRIILAEGSTSARFAVAVTDDDGAPIEGASIAVSARRDRPANSDAAPITGRAEQTAAGRYETEPLEMDDVTWHVTVRASSRGEPSPSASWHVVAPVP